MLVAEEKGLNLCQAAKDWRRVGVVHGRTSKLYSGDPDGIDEYCVMSLGHSGACVYPSDGRAKVDRSGHAAMRDELEAFIAVKL